jgi:hypothetical protein
VTAQKWINTAYSCSDELLVKFDKCYCDKVHFDVARQVLPSDNWNSWLCLKQIVRVNDCEQFFLLCFFYLTNKNWVQHLCHIPVDSHKRISLPTAGANSLSCSIAFQNSIISPRIRTGKRDINRQIEKKKKMTKSGGRSVVWVNYSFSRGNIYGYCQVLTV